MRPKGKSRYRPGNVTLAWLLIAIALLAYLLTLWKFRPL